MGKARSRGGSLSAPALVAMQPLPSLRELYPTRRSPSGRTLLSPPAASSHSVLHTDIAAPGALSALASARASATGDLVLLSTDRKQTDLAANLVANLLSVGIDHYFILGSDVRTCDAYGRRLACV